MAVFKIDFFSTSLSRLAPMTVILPVEKPQIPGVTIPDKDEPFKSIYLLHGYSGSNNDWLYGTRIEALARMFNVAVIMPSGENSFYLDDNKRGQYYEKLICEEIVEFTRKVFPLSDKREDTTIAGLSMGGYGAVRNGLWRSDVFGSIFGLSSALITDKLHEMKDNPKALMAPYSYYEHTFGDLDNAIGSDIDPKAIAANLMRDKKPLPKMFLACGSEDFLIESNRSLHEYLDEIGYEHEYREGPGIHNWDFWDKYIEEAMIWLYGKPEPPVGEG